MEGFVHECTGICVRVLLCRYLLVLFSFSLLTIKQPQGIASSLSKQHHHKRLHASIHPTIFYPGSGREGSRFRRVSQMCLSPATLYSSSWGTLRWSKAKRDIQSLQRPSSWTMKRSLNSLGWASESLPTQRVQSIVFHQRIKA